MKMIYQRKNKILFSRFKSKIIVLKAIRLKMIYFLMILKWASYEHLCFNLMLYLFVKIKA